MATTPSELMAYIDRSNVETILLEYRPEGEDNYETVPEGSALRAVFKFGDYCIDTDVVSHPIELSVDATKVHMQLGLVANLVTGKYKKAKLTIYDDNHAEGAAWDSYTVIVQDWNVCPI